MPIPDQQDGALGKKKARRQLGDRRTFRWQFTRVNHDFDLNKPEDMAVGCATTGHGRTSKEMRRECDSVSRKWEGRLGQDSPVEDVEAYRQGWNERLSDGIGRERR